MRAKFTIATTLLILATVLFWRFAQSGFFRKPATGSTQKSFGSIASATPALAATSGSASDDSVSDPANRSAFVALRYDKTRVFFLLDELDDDIVPGDQLSQRLRTLDAPATKLGPSQLWEPDDDLVQSYQKLYGLAHTGEEWHLQLSSNLNIPVVIQKPVVAGVGCFTAAGFLAEIPASAQADFTASAKQYFLISRNPSSTGNSNQIPTQPAQVAELKSWKASTSLRKQIEQLLKARLQEQLPQIRADAESEYARQDSIRELWKPIDESLAHGEGKLEYDTHAFQLTTDRTPRLFVRAKWTVGDKPAFLMSLWLRIQPALAIESLDSDASFLQRTSEFQNTALDLDSLGEVLNVFDLQGDGRGTFLFYSMGTESFELRLYRYTDAGPVETDIALEGGC